MPKKFEDILNQTGPYYLTAVDKVRPYIDQLPCDLTAYDRMDADLCSRSAALYNDIEDYKGKRAKGALLAIYQYVDELKRQGIAQNLPGKEVLTELQEQFKALLISTTPELIKKFKTFIPQLQETVDRWKVVMTPHHDKKKVLSIYQTAYLTFTILHLKTGETKFLIMPGISDLRADLSKMMGELKQASDEFLQLIEQAEKVRLENEQKALEDKEKAEEAQKGLFAELEGALKRAKRHVLDKIDKEKQHIKPKLPSIQLLITLIQALNMDDDLQTFWRIFSNERLFKQLLVLFNLSEESREAWLSTFYFQTGQGLISYLWGATLDQDRLEKEAVAATNKVLNIHILGKHNALANLLRTQREYSSGTTLQYLEESNTVLREIETIFNELSDMMQVLSPIPRIDNLKASSISDDEEMIKEEAVLIFERIKKEMMSAREKLNSQHDHLANCLAKVRQVQLLIQTKLKRPFNLELAEKFSKLVEEIYVKVFEVSPIPHQTTDAILQILSTTHPQMLFDIDRAISEQQEYAVTLNNTVAEKRMSALKDFMSKTSKSLLHCIFYLFSSTYHRYYDEVKLMLSTESSVQDISLIQYKHVTGMIQSSKEKLWGWSPTGLFVKNVSQKLGTSYFFSINEEEEQGLVTQHARTQMMP